MGKTNAQFKEKFPELHSWLSVDQVEQIDFPTEPPSDAGKSSKYKLFVRIVGIILCSAVFSFIFLNCLPTILLTCCLGCCIYCLRSRVDEDFAIASILLSGYSGVLLAPIACVFGTLYFDDTWDEIQSWMIAYITWGCCSFL